MTTARPVERLAYSPTEVGRMLGLSRETVCRMAREGILPTLETGNARRTLIPAGPLFEWAKATRRPIDDLEQAS